MKDLIERQAAIDAVTEYGSENSIYMSVGELKRRIEALPSVQPERKTGKCIWCDSPFRIEYYWIDREGCTASFQDEERHIVATGIAKYCPNCGADMRGEQDGSD